MKLVVASLAVVALVVGFILVPSEKPVAAPNAEPTRWSDHFEQPAPTKSGLRIAVEGRLRWLGL